MVSGWSSSAVVVILGVTSSVEVELRFKNHATRRDSGIGTERGAEAGGGKVRSVVQLDLLHYPGDRDSSL